MEEGEVGGGGVGEGGNVGVVWGREGCGGWMGEWLGEGRGVEGKWWGWGGVGCGGGRVGEASCGVWV